LFFKIKGKNGKKLDVKFHGKALGKKCPFPKMMTSAALNRTTNSSFIACFLVDEITPEISKITLDFLERKKRKP
jgi:TusA-related sulfurtransferase